MTEAAKPDAANSGIWSILITSHLGKRLAAALGADQ